LPHHAESVLEVSQLPDGVGRENLRDVHMGFSLPAPASSACLLWVEAGWITMSEARSLQGVAEVLPA
jgi:hypothetical protein